MAVYYRQLVDGIQLDDTHVIEPHFDGQTDSQLLKAKFEGAVDKGWSVVTKDKGKFAVRKARWQDNDVVREFWVE